LPSGHLRPDHSPVVPSTVELKERAREEKKITKTYTQDYTHKTKLQQFFAFICGISVVWFVIFFFNFKIQRRKYQNENYSVVYFSYSLIYKFILKTFFFFLRIFLKPMPY
jgi:hypothetical protein